MRVTHVGRYIRYAAGATSINDRTSCPLGAALASWLTTGRGGDVRKYLIHAVCNRPVDTHARTDS
jgi:hypothetical protein